MEDCNITAEFVLGLEGCNAEVMLAKLAAPVGKLQVEITRTIVARNCCPNVDCSLIKMLLKEMRMLLMLPIKRPSPGNTVLLTADEAMSSFASGRFRGRRVAAVL